MYVCFPQCKYHHHLRIYFMSLFCFLFKSTYFVSKVSYLVTNLNSDHEKVKLQRPLVAYFNVTLYLFI